MNERQGSPTALSDGGARPEARGSGPPLVPPAPMSARPTRWTAGRIVALVIGALLALWSIGLLGAGGTALWADLSHRDSAGFVTTDVHSFSTGGSALATEPVELGNPGVDWLYSTVILGNVRLRVTPVDTGSTVFVGIAPTADAQRYLAGSSYTLISDFWTDTTQGVAGGTTPPAPSKQHFWVASATGAGPQTVTWDPANGSWTVVVMNADAHPGVDVRTDLGAEMPSLIGIAVAALVLGGIFLLGGILLIVGAIRRVRRAGRSTA